MPSLDSILDELVDHLAAERRHRKHAGPRWQITVSDAPRGYTVIVELYGETIVEAFGRSLDSAKQKALDTLRAFVDDQEPTIVTALEVSLREAVSR